ncbi:MAG: methyltransferase domain-containing protein [Elusimicrobia bacterium]|nr:methyltransferase domain-containing protein [Elusimicrobiota bacterium]
MKKKTDWGLRFYYEVLKLENLHFGLWEGEELTLDNARKAQKRYTERLLEMIPEGVGSVLDVGCGTGVTARRLAGSGYRVECVNPDAYQEEIFREKSGSAIPFHRVRFESFQSASVFDLVLMSESSQYIDTDRMTEALGRVLRPGGYLLVADYFRKTDSPYYRTCRLKDDFIGRLADGGLEPVETLDVTRAVLPNLVLGRKLYDEYAVPVVRIIADYLKTVPGYIRSAGSLILGKKIKKISHYVFGHTPEKLDERKFAENMEYLFLLFKKKS